MKNPERIPPSYEVRAEEYRRSESRRSKFITLASAVGLIAFAAASVPLQETGYHFPARSVTRELTQKEKRDGAIVAATVPIELRDEIDCGGKRGFLIHMFDSNNAPLNTGTQANNFEVICAKEGSKITQGQFTLY
jgi:hypothetical protein